MTQTTQEQDVRAVGTHPEQLDRFYREHLPYVRQYIARRLDDPGDVADVTADIFLRVVRSASSYRAELGPAKAWLTGIARHALAEHHEREARRDATVRQIAGRRWLDEDSAERIVQRVSAEAEARELLTLIAGLPVTLRPVVELVAVDGLTVSEAAAVLNITAGAARVRYHRGRRLLHSSRTTSRQDVAP